MIQKCTSHIINLFLIFAIGIFYLWTATSNSKPFQISWGETNYYHYEALGFKLGQMSLPIDVHPKLLELPDPYDPIQNAPYRVHDLSLFHGKYYLYFGLTPALILYLPIHLLTGTSVPDSFAVFIFLWVGLIWCYFCLDFLVTEWKFSYRMPFLMLGTLVMGLSNFGPFILRRPLVYEVSIAAGYCFFFGSLFHLIKGTFGKKNYLFHIILSTVFFSLAVGARPPYILASFIFGLSYLWLLRKNLNFNLKKSLSLMLAYVVPLFIGIFALLLFNYLRFGEWLNFGQKYQLAGVNMKTVLFSLKGFWYKFKLFFLGVPLIDRKFPFFHPCLKYLPPMPKDLEISLEPITGIIYSSPIVLFSMFSCFYSLKALVRRHSPEITYILSVVLVIVSLTLAGLFSCFIGLTERYLVDIVPCALFAALLAWITVINQKSINKMTRNIISGSFVVFACYSILFNLAISLVGYGDLLKGGNPKLYQKIEDKFRFLSHESLR